jgi:hypothetical protein
LHKPQDPTPTPPLKGRGLTSQHALPHAKAQRPNTRCILYHAEAQRRKEGVGPNHGNRAEIPLPQAGGGLASSVPQTEQKGEPGGHGPMSARVHRTAKATRCANIISHKDAKTRRRCWPVSLSSKPISWVTQLSPECGIPKHHRNSIFLGRKFT